MTNRSAQQRTISSELAETQWKCALDLTDEMLQAARQADWESVAKLESQRQPVLVTIFDRPAEKANVRMIAENVQHIVDADVEIRRLGEARLGHLQAELAGIKKNQKATLVYARAGP